MQNNNDLLLKHCTETIVNLNAGLRELVQRKDWSTIQDMRTVANGIFQKAEQIRDK